MATAAAAAAAAVSLDETKAKNVVRQVEFYFSDSNLPRDGFLRKTVEESEDGLVSLALICSFANMRSYLGLDASVKEASVPETTVLAVAKVLRCSTALRVSDDGKKVGRANELLKPDEIIEQGDSRSIAASPLPHNVKLEDVKSFFAQHGKVNSVRLPKHVSDKRHFCGTALVEFSEEEEVNSVMEKKLSFAGVDFEMKQKKEFDTEREAKKEDYEESNPNKKCHDEGYPKGPILGFKRKKTLADGDTKQNGVNKVNDTETAKKERTCSSTAETPLEDLKKFKLQEFEQTLKDHTKGLLARRRAISEGLMQHMEGKDGGALAKLVKSFKQTLSPEQDKAFLSIKKQVFNAALQCTLSVSRETIEDTNKLMKCLGRALGKVAEARSSNCQPR